MAPPGRSAGSTTEPIRVFAADPAATGTPAPLTAPTWLPASRPPDTPPSEMPASREPASKDPASGADEEACPQPPRTTPTAIIVATKRDRAEAFRMNVSGLACCYQSNDGAWLQEKPVTLLTGN